MAKKKRKWHAISSFSVGVYTVTIYIAKVRCLCRKWTVKLDLYIARA